MISRLALLLLVPATATTQRHSRRILMMQMAGAVTEKLFTAAFTNSSQSVTAIKRGKGDGRGICMRKEGDFDVGANESFIFKTFFT